MGVGGVIQMGHAVGAFFPVSSKCVCEWERLCLWLWADYQGTPGQDWTPSMPWFLLLGTLRLNYMCIPVLSETVWLSPPHYSNTGRERERGRGGGLCHRSLTVCHSLCSLSAETISINTRKQVGGGGLVVVVMWTSEKDGHKAWQHLSFFCCSLQCIVSWHCDSLSGVFVSPHQSRQHWEGGHAVPVKVKQGRQLWKLVARL